METIKDVIEQANRKVDGILAMEAKAQAREKHKRWSGRETLPETIRDLLDEFVRVTGITPSKRELSQWLMEGQEWVSQGITVKDIVSANEQARIQNFLIVSPMSITKTARALAAQRRASGKDYEAVKQNTAHILQERDTWQKTEQPHELYEQTKARLKAIQEKQRQEWLERQSNGNHGS